jgi:hypothetical protein
MSVSFLDDFRGIMMILQRRGYMKSRIGVWLFSEATKEKVENY